MPWISDWDDALLHAVVGAGAVVAGTGVDDSARRDGDLGQFFRVVQFSDVAAVATATLGANL